MSVENSEANEDKSMLLNHGVSLQLMIMDDTCSYPYRASFLSGDRSSNIEEDGADNANKCSNRARKWSRGIMLTILISFSWVGSLHLFKMCFERGRSRTMIHYIDLEQFNKTLNNTFSDIPDAKDDEVRARLIVSNWISEIRFQESIVGKSKQITSARLTIKEAITI